MRSGAAVARALRALGHHVSEVDPVERKWRLPAGTDAVFLALHGTYGEDGQVQAELSAAGVPFTGTGEEGSRVAFDKILSKKRFETAAVPTPRWAVMNTAADLRPEALRMPMVLKPACQGSSVGLQFVEHEGEWSRALQESFRHGDRVLCEEKISGREVTVAILGDQPLPVVEICPKQGAYDYHNKYTKGATDYFCPADFDAATTRRLQAVGLMAFHAVGAQDYGRTDLIVPETGPPVVLEVNTLPGMTETSLFPKAAAAAGIGFNELCGRMVELALARAAHCGSNH